MEWWSPFECARTLLRVTNCRVWMLQKSNQKPLSFIYFYCVCYCCNTKNTTWTRPMENDVQRREENGPTLNEIKLSYHFILCFYLSFFFFHFHFHLLFLFFARSRMDFEESCGLSSCWSSCFYTLHSVQVSFIMNVVIFFPTSGHHSSVLGYSVNEMQCIWMHLWSAIQTYHVSHIHISVSVIEKPLKLFLCQCSSKNIFGCLFLYCSFQNYRKCEHSHILK